MNPHTDATHDPGLESWVESANAPDCDFPIQNLPLGRFRRSADEAWRLGMAIGDQVLDLRAAGLVAHADMNRRSPMSTWACPARSATTPTSTPACTTRRPSASSSARTTRCCPTTSGCRSATTAVHRRSVPAATVSHRPNGSDQGARAPTHPSSVPARGSTTNSNSASSSDDRPNAMGDAVTMAAGRKPCLWAGVVQRLERARHPGLGVPAAGAVPVEELRQHAVAVDRDDGGAGAVPPGRSPVRPTIRSRCPISIRPRTGPQGAIDIELEVWLQTAKMRRRSPR
jgi:hypothetical protein